VGKLEGKGTLGRPRRKGEDDTEMYIQERGRGSELYWYASGTCDGL